MLKITAVEGDRQALSVPLLSEAKPGETWLVDLLVTSPDGVTRSNMVEFTFIKKREVYDNNIHH